MGSLFAWVVAGAVIGSLLAAIAWYSTNHTARAGGAIGETAKLDNEPNVSGPVKWEFDGIFSMGTYLGDPTLRFSQFIIHGTNVSSRPIGKIAGYIRSNITGETLQVFVVTDGKLKRPEEIASIPSEARIEIVAPFGPDSSSDIAQMLDEPTLLRRFGDSTFVVDLDGNGQEHHFSRDDIERMIVYGKRLLYGVPQPTVRAKD